MSPNFLSTITGSFAAPAAENPTVAMMSAAYAHHDLDAQYINCEVAAAGLADAVRGARAMGWVGFNCSLPHKVAVVRHLDDIAESATVIGAVNCVVARGDRLVGENTDGKGFLESLRSVCDPVGTHLAIIGAGGAARAIAVELALAGAATVTIANRSRPKAQELAEIVEHRTSARVQVTTWSPAAAMRVPIDAQILVNATSLGLYPAVTGQPAVDPDSLRSDLVVADVIPNPPDTAFLEQARSAGCVTLDGLGMLVNQGRAAIRLWTGVDADPSVMRTALVDALGLGRRA